MSRLDRELSSQFHRWEVRGRGWQVFDEPVYPEPPFVPFDGHYLPAEPAVDDGRRPTFLSSIVQGLSRKLSTQPEPPARFPEPEPEPEPEVLVRNSLIELQTSLPANLDIPREAFGQFLLNLSMCREPISFELVGTVSRVVFQFTAHTDDAPLLRRQLQAHFPEATFRSQQGALEQAWDSCEGEDILVVDFGLAREFMLPLASGKLDPFVGIVGAMAELRPDEVAVFQVIFQPAEHPWAESIERSVTHADGKPFFVNLPELSEAAETKIARPLYAAVVRLAMRTNDEKRTLQLARDLAGSLRVFSDPHGNHLIPLTNDEYPFESHVEDVLRRQSRRTGMLLNGDELVGFVHLPGSAVRSPALMRDAGKTKPAPSTVRDAEGILLGNNVHLGESVPVHLTIEQRLRHCHVIGATGTGKSTFLFNLIAQDIENGEGIAVLDPHGDLVDQILGAIPSGRIGDVILIDPSDEEYSIGFNILDARSDLEKNLLASDLVSIFQRLSTSWGDQMNSVLQNAILAFLESEQGGTLADLRRFLIEPAFRDSFLRTVRDPDIVYYWRKAFSQLSGNRSIGPVLTRLDAFLSPKPIRYMVSQQKSRIDFREILDGGKIFLAKLSQGQIGKENSYLLGSLFVAKFQQLVMGRQAKREEARRPFFLYADEFHHFITPSLAEIVAGARKYGLGLVLAHEELQQLERNQDVKSAVLSNPYTRVVFRVGSADARALEGGFSFFEAKDFQNLGTGEAICRVEKADGDFNLTVPLPRPADSERSEAVRQSVVAASRAKYATLRSEVAAAVLAKSQAEEIREEPKTDVPKTTDSGKEKSVVEPVLERPVVEVPPVEKPAVSIEKEPERDLGRGGEQHKSIQERLQREAHTLGFSAEIEKQLDTGSNCAADLVLRRGGVAIAVEIAITTTIDHEFGNVKKCLAGGFSRVAVVSPLPEKLKRIKAAVEGGLGTDAAGKVSYHGPDDFIAELRKMAAGAAPKSGPPGERVIRGFKVRRHGPELSPEERKAKETVAQEILAEVMKPKPGASS